MMFYYINIEQIQDVFLSVTSSWTSKYDLWSHHTLQ